MSISKSLKLVFGLGFAVLAVYLWPQYQTLVPQTSEVAQQGVLAEIAGVSAQAPLTLVVEPDDGLAVLNNAIAQATKSLDLVIYELEDPAIEQALVEAQSRGIKVRVILQNVNTFGRHPNQAGYDFLKSHNVPIIWAPKYFALTHQKTLIVDNQWALIMTFNLAPQYYASGRDFVLVNRDPKDVAAIAAAFQSDWQGSQVIADNGADLVWSPGAAPALLALIDGAKTTLDIYNEEMAEPRVTAALERAAARGVAVRVTMTYATNWKPALNELTIAGVRVRTFTASAPLYIHAKVIVADNERVFIGSENFSTQSLDSNRELGIVIARPDIISAVEKIFAHDWAAARPYTVR